MMDINSLKNTSPFAYIWLARVLGPGNAKSFEIMERFSGAETLCTMDSTELKNTGVFSKAELNRAAGIEPESILKTIEYCKKNAIRIITPLDSEYPAGFGFIEMPPLVIYARGEILDNSRPCFGMVGSRKSTDFGLKAAYSLSARLSLSGFTVVSGGALGIDSMAHWGALASGGKTVAVLGSGIDSDYLKSNKKLREEIEKQGTVITEFEPKTPATKFTFPIRNRLISALSGGVAVIEAGGKSGALITAGYAMEQGKEVFTLPGSINQREYDGNNALLRDGAIPVIKADDIIEVYLGRFPNLKPSAELSPEIKARFRTLFEELKKPAPKSRKSKPEIKQKSIPKAEKEPKSQSFKDINGFKGSENALKILKVFESETEMSDVLAARSNISGGAFITAITELEIKGYIAAVPVGRYRRK